MKKLSLEVEWFVGILQSEFGVTVGVDDIAVEAVELGLDEVEEVFVPHEVIEGLPETLLYEIMTVDDAAGNEWIGAVGFHVDSPECCIQVITKNGKKVYRKTFALP